MIVELGSFALVLAAVLAAVLAVVPQLGAARGHPGLMAVAEPAATALFLAVLTAYGALTYAFVVSDFSVAVVAKNSHSAKPLLYKIAGVWGNHEGSMLLWVLILAFFAALVAWFGGGLRRRLRARVLALQGFIALGFLLFMLITSHPFARLAPAPLDGQDLNPLLQDPGLAFHPPLLYLGYVGFSVTFAFAGAALLEGRIDAAWARWLRPWVLLAWTALTLGIALGSWWAYYELGWGGWWFWDPVENASLLPWLAGTALLHSALVVEKRATLKSWTLLLAVLTFALSLMGTFLVRSGLLTSVHAFATDPDRGLFILGLLVVYAGGALALYAWRAPYLQGGGLFAPLSREGMLVLNNLLLATATATVLLGTLYPLILEALGGPSVSVGPPYYDATFLPLMAPLVALMGVGPLMPWKRGDLAGALGRLKVALATAGAAFLVGGFAAWGETMLAPIGIALAAWVLASSVTILAERAGFGRRPAGVALRRLVRQPPGVYGVVLGHGGLGVALLGMVAVTGWQSELHTALKPGEQASIAGYTVTLKGVETVTGKNWVADQARLTVRRNGQKVATLTPQQRYFPVADDTTTQMAIYPRGGLGNLLATVGEQRDSGARAVQLRYHPLAVLMWLGAAIMAVGGAIALFDRGLRVGVPRRRQAAPAAAQPAE